MVDADTTKAVTSLGCSLSKHDAEFVFRHSDPSKHCLVANDAA